MVGMDTPPALRSLLVAASDRCRPVACSAGEPDPDPMPAAYVWCGSSARPPRGIPYAAWLNTPADLELAVVRDAAVVLCPTVPLLAVADERGLFVPAAPFDGVVHPLLPFLRRRLRQARGLPDVAIAVADGQTWYWDEPPHPLPADLVDTAAGVASAVVATGSALTRALVWAAPTVTDPDSAALVGAVDGVHVLVGAEPDARRDAARMLAGDDESAARLAQAGRLLGRDRVNLGHAARTMLARLGLPAHPLAGALSGLEDELDTLTIPEYSPFRLRTRMHVAPLPRRLPDEGVR